MEPPYATRIRVAAMTPPTNPTDAPTLAVIGGGQLARMMQQAAIALGVPIRLLAEGADVSAAQVVREPLIGDYRDLATLREAAEHCSVVTFDHEHVPPEHLRTLDAEGHACRPGPHALLYAQDKYEMRARLTELGAPCPRWSLVDDAADVEGFAKAGSGFPVVLKTTRGGYDGKGVWTVRSADDAADAFASGARILAEDRVQHRDEEFGNCRLCQPT